jgi:DNA-binding helix-hairpin-helix protein with protein kinase domain
MPQVSRGFIAIVGLLQLIAGIAWAVWTVFSEEGLRQLIGLLPAAVLIVGALVPVLAARFINESKELAAELQRMKTINRLDTKLATVKERLEFFGGLREWGIISEEELLEKRRALLDLGDLSPAELSSYRSAGDSMKGTGGHAGTMTADPRSLTPATHTPIQPKKPRSPRKRLESGR